MENKIICYNKLLICCNKLVICYKDGMGRGVNVYNRVADLRYQFQTYDTAYVYLKIPLFSWHKWAHIEYIQLSGQHSNICLPTVWV
jgi:hypothetical protein